MFRRHPCGVLHTNWYISLGSTISSVINIFKNIKYIQYVKLLIIDIIGITFVKILTCLVQSPICFHVMCSVRTQTAECIPCDPRGSCPNGTCLCASCQEVLDVCSSGPKHVVVIENLRVVCNPVV
jgi:hypothetical protein